MLLRNILKRSVNGDKLDSEEVSLKDKIHKKIIKRRNSPSVGGYTTCSSSPRSFNTSSEDILQMDYEDYEYNTSTIEDYLEDQNKKFNHLIEKNLKYVGYSNDLSECYKLNEFSDEQVDLFLQKVNKDTKIKMHNKLNSEFQSHSNKYSYDERVADEMFLNNLSLLEKFEIIVIFIIKLNFLIIKYSLPLSKFVYHKFVSNQLILFNRNNFNKFVNLIIKLINNIDQNYQGQNFETTNLNNVREFEVQLENLQFRRPSLWSTLSAAQMVGLYHVAEEFTKKF